MQTELHSDLTTVILSKINIEAFYRRYIPDFKSFGAPVLCPLHNDTSPSLKINSNGSFKCFSPACIGNKGGRSPIGFYQFYNKIDSFFEAQRRMYHEEVEPVIEEIVIKRYMGNLFNEAASEFLQWLEVNRGWSRKVMYAFGLGLTKSGDRITIPIHNRFAFCTTLLLYNVKHHPSFPHTATLNKGMSTTMLWPRNILSSSSVEQVLLCEGQSDTIAACSIAVPAVTVGSSNNIMSSEDMLMLQGKEVHVCYDMDEPGRIGAHKMADNLVRSGIEKVKIIELPFEDENNTDLTDWLVKEKRKKDDLINIIAGTDYYKTSVPVFFETKKELVKSDKRHPFVSLSGIRKQENFNKDWVTECVVSGIHDRTLLAPRIIRLTCKKPNPKKCGHCVFNLDPKHQAIEEFKASDKDLVKVIEESHRNILNVCKDRRGLGKGCIITAEILKTHELSKILVTEPVQSAGTRTECVQIFGYYFGINVVVNMPYQCTGYTTTHPKDGSMVAIFRELKPIASSLEDFKITDSVRQSLLPFRVSENDDLFTYFMELYNTAAYAITKIRGRPELHMAVDLAFHSPVSFILGKEYHRKGSIECLIFGDERCGKGYVAERLQQYYEVGEVVNAENVSFMNLVAGIKMITGFRGIAWGRLAMRHRDTIIIDEMGELHPDTLGALSRIRSEGYAEISKDGLTGKANAICGIIWLSNPRDKRSMAQFTFGITAFQGLMPAAADQARFDYVMAVKKSEVPASVINSPETNTAEFPFTKEQCHDLIMWIKSRKEDEIIFTPDAQSLILEKTIEMADTYSGDIPLVLAENFRFKLAKVAASIAGRIWNSDPSGEILMVDRRCVECAVNFYHTIYDSETLGYRYYSDLDKKQVEFDQELISRTIKRAAIRAQIQPITFVEQIVVHQHLTEHDLEIILKAEISEVREFIHTLSSQNCLLRKHNFYVKSIMFNEFLRRCLQEGIQVQETLDL